MFQLFDKFHIIYLIGYILLSIIFYYLVLHSKNRLSLLKRGSIVTLIIKLIEIGIRYNEGAPWYTLLPLHLCNLTLILVIIASIFNNKFLYNITFYWSLGAIFALITPEVRNQFPSFLNISFFITHIYVLLTSVIQYKIFNLRPTFKSWYTAFIYLNVASIIIFFINKILGTNYLYINRKPDFPSPLDYFGAWPKYIFVVLIAYMILTFLLYICFKERKKGEI